jgi:hypothetical protein
MQAKQTEAPVVTSYSLIAAWPGRNGGSATTGSGGDALGANCSTGGTGGPALEEMQAKGGISDGGPEGNGDNGCEGPDSCVHSIF